MDLEFFLVSLYVRIDDWRQADSVERRPGPGRPAALSDGEVLTLAVLSQWPRWRSERDFWRFADLYLREYFPKPPKKLPGVAAARGPEPEYPMCQTTKPE